MYIYICIYIYIGLEISTYTGFMGVVGIYIWYFQWTIRCIFLVNGVWELGKSPGILCSMKFWTHHRISVTDAVGQQEKVTQKHGKPAFNPRTSWTSSKNTQENTQENPMENSRTYPLVN